MINRAEKGAIRRYYGGVDTGAERVKQKQEKGVAKEANIVKFGQRQAEENKESHSSE